MHPAYLLALCIAQADPGGGGGINLTVGEVAIVGALLTAVSGIALKVIFRLLGVVERQNRVYQRLIAGKHEPADPED